jgi:hypothetical protein
VDHLVAAEAPALTDYRLLADGERARGYSARHIATGDPFASRAR